MRKLWLLLALWGCDARAAGDVPAAVEPSAAVEATATATATGTGTGTGTESSTSTSQAAPEGMVKIPAGVFVMGAFAAVGNPEERPAHEGIVPSFFMDATEVTTAAYKKCVAAGGCPKAHIDQLFCNTEPEAVDRDQHPINCIDLKMADAFCRWAGKRLPTEREWEYAASGGNERRRFSWGPLDPSVDNSCYDHPGGSCPVKSFAAGAFGLHDMTGNVWEWTASRFDPYPSHDTPDVIEKKGRLMYVYRGGSWSRRFPKWMRNLLRNRYEPDQYSASIGMRCVKAVEPIECPAETAPKAGAAGVCARVSGPQLCEPHYTHNGKECLPDVAGETAKLAGTWPPPDNTASIPPGSGSSGGPGETASAAPVSNVISRSRTPQHDADCQRHWPKTPASYLYTGGANYPSRKPAVSSAGCVPRDMGWSWTSACCPG